MATPTAAKEYICPGERHPISRAVHLARQAASFQACRACPFRDRPAAGESPEAAAATAEPPRRDVFAPEGVRGVFLNEMTRSIADALAARFAALLWEDATVAGPNDGVDRGARQVRPTVIVGYDERPSSLSIYTGAVSALRRMGCHIVNIGLAARPCFWFAIDHLRASGGILATASGCEPPWAGLDFARGHARPLSSDGGLQRLRALLTEPTSRPTRTAGTYRVFHAGIPYRASLAKHFHDPRPLTVVCASASTVVRETLEHVFANLPCRLVTLELPTRVRDPARRRDPDMIRLSSAVRSGGADVGILIDDDGQRCGFVDERGRYVSPAAIARLLLPTTVAEHPAAGILLEPEALAALGSRVAELGGKALKCPATFAGIADALGNGDARYAGGDSGRHWFLDSMPTCDAVLSLGKTLLAISRAEAPFSELIAVTA
jgi:phosphomannomutase